MTHFKSNKTSDPWGSQIRELQKLPLLLQVSSTDDILSHIGYPILGVNTAQVYMKVSGNRTGVHQEDGSTIKVITSWKTIQK